MIFKHVVKGFAELEPLLAVLSAFYINIFLLYLCQLMPHASCSRAVSAWVVMGSKLWALLTNLAEEIDGKAVFSSLFHGEVAGCCCKTEAIKQPLAVAAEAASAEAPDADLGKMQPFFSFFFF